MTMCVCEGQYTIMWSMSDIVFTGSSLSGLSLFNPPCQPPHSGHFQHSHPLWTAVIIAKLYAHMAASQPLKPHRNITQRSFNESLTGQRCIKAPSSLLSSEKYSTWVYHSPAFMTPSVCRGAQLLLSSLLLTTHSPSDSVSKHRDTNYTLSLNLRS